MELSERKKQILKLVVELYIESAEPVSSKAVAKEMNISSATVRNEFSELTELGYLEQPHTSAGRVPSPQGYRLYVNELMERRPISPQEAEAIDRTLGGKLRGLDNVISRAGQMVSALVNYPVYTVKAGRSAPAVSRFELLSVDEQSFIAVVMTDARRVRSELLHTPLSFDGGRLGELKELLNAQFTHLPEEDMSARLMGVQLPPELFLVLSRTVEYAGAILREAARTDVMTAGESQLLKMPEYRDADRAHELMTFLADNKDRLPAPEDGAPLRILIGPENVSEALRDTSVVVASYDIGDGMRGLVGVVGPTRMDYARVTARLAYFADSLTRMFGKNELPPGRGEDE